MAENAYVGEAELHASVGGTEENNLAIPDHERQHQGLPRGNESAMQGFMHQNVEQAQFHTVNDVKAIDNTDDMEPGQAKINQQVQIQQRSHIISNIRTPNVAASMQTKHMPTAQILSDHVSVGGKSQMHQPTTKFQDFIGEQMATRSNLTEKQGQIRGNGQTNEQEFQIETQNVAGNGPRQAPDNPTQVYNYKQEPMQLHEQQQLQQHNAMQMMMNQTGGGFNHDPKMLTKSTLDGGDHHRQVQGEDGRQRGPYPAANGGYISDFYKNKQYAPQGDERQQMGSQVQHMGVGTANMNDGGTQTNNNMPQQVQKLNQIQSKKFFKSKIDFAAPIKSLQHKGGTNDPNLSDDSYMIEAGHHGQQAFHQFTQGQPLPQLAPGGIQSQISMMGTGQAARAISQNEIDSRQAKEFVPDVQPMTQMEGYTNLSLIKEEDFNKRGVGHLHAKNSSKRVYQPKRQAAANSHVNTQAFSKGRKASEATTVGGNVGQAKNYNSVDNRYQTPLKLPSLANPASKRSSNANSSNAYRNQHLSTVVESNHSKHHAHAHQNGKTCHLCSKKQRVSQPHNSHSGGMPQRNESGVKGAPYYQPMSLQKSPKVSFNKRSNSNGRGEKIINRSLRQPHQPKWLKKEFQPVFKMPPPKPESQTIEHHASTDFGQFAGQSQQLPPRRPDIVTLENQQSSFDPQAISPRSEQPGSSINAVAAPFTNAHKQKNFEIKKQASVGAPAEHRSHMNASNNSGKMSHDVYQDAAAMAININKPSRAANMSQTRNHASPPMVPKDKMMSTGSTVFSITPQAARQIQQYKQLPMAYRSINKFQQSFHSQGSRVMEQGRHPKDPELICTEKQLPENIEEEIKDGFFELKQKFKDVGPSSIYISHVTLHEKHPLLRKIEIETLKTLLLESSVIYLSVNQTLYRYGSQDNFIYIILFGRLLLQVPDRIRSNRVGANGETDVEQQTQYSQQTQHLIGRCNIGWTLGEEILFDRNLQIRQEMAVAETESCLIGINKSQLAIMQKNLLESGNDKDYFVIESILKGNFLVKDQWRREFHEGILHSKGGASNASHSDISNAKVQIANPQNKRKTGR